VNQKSIKATNTFIYSLSLLHRFRFRTGVLQKQKGTFRNGHRGYLKDNCSPYPSKADAKTFDASKRQCIVKMILYFIHLTRRCNHKIFLLLLTLTDLCLLFGVADRKRLSSKM